MRGGRCVEMGEKRGGREGRRERDVGSGRHVRMRGGCSWPYIHIAT